MSDHPGSKGPQLVALHELVPGFSSEDPATGASLLQADVDSLSTVAKQLRRHLVDAMNATERPAILHAQTAYDLLRKRHLQPPKDRWTAYQLDRDRRTVRTPHPNGGTRNVLVVTRKFPEADDLPALPAQGTWLVVWHGDVDVLAIPGVTTRIARLRAALPIADVLFWDVDDGHPTLRSLAAGRGLHRGKAVSFPNPDLLRDADPTNPENLRDHRTHTKAGT